MKKPIQILLSLVIFSVLGTVGAAAVVNDTVRVGLRYGDSALSAANLENDRGSGYDFGYYDDDRRFVPLDSTGETRITMLPGGGGVTATATDSGAVLFASDGDALAVLPAGDGDPATWFRGERYRGGFEYTRTADGALAVVNVVDLEDYVKGVVPYELDGSWPEEALKAQAVCARNFVCRTTKHLRSDGFDVCTGTNCQVYRGLGTAAKGATDATDAAVDATAGVCMYYDGELVEAVYHSSDGGATEDAANVWGSEIPYLKGKIDPYEAAVSIPGYAYSVTYTQEELTWILQNSGYDIGTVRSVAILERTPLGNVSRLAFTDTSGAVVTVKGESCRMAFYSSTYQKSVRSMRFTLGESGVPGGGGLYYVNDPSHTLGTLDGASAISGKGVLSTLGSTPSILSSAGTEQAAAGSGVSDGPDGFIGDGGPFTLSGTGYGHNVGMSQYGARGMAQQGYSYEDILHFYFTDVTIA